MLEKAVEAVMDELEFSTFKIGDSLLGINILNIQEINKQHEITTVPQSEDYIEGILNLRGRIVTIIDLGKKLGLVPVERNQNNKNIIVDSDGEYVGLLVDSISDVVTASEGEIDPPPPNTGGVDGKFFQGVLKREEQLIGILDINAILAE